MAWANARGVLTSVKMNDESIVCVLTTLQAGENLLERIEGLSLLAGKWEREEACFVKILKNLKSL